MESVYSQYAWLIPLFPLLAFFILTAMGRQMKETGVNIAIAASGLSFILAIMVFFERLGSNMEGYTRNGIQWFEIGDFSLKMGFEINNLNALMLVIVTLVSLLVNIYSKGYMHGDERITVFFGYVALFAFSMIALVISENIVEFYIFWEMVGVCSFLLIGFWYNQPASKAAAKKAFIVTRIGDLGLFIALLALFHYMPDHAMDFTSIQNVFSTHQISAGVTTLIAILIFIAAIGKSGQFPLHVWLPDAMEGPTPISALIHAATMVAAGVYLVARTFDIFQASPSALIVVACVGGFTAIFAATIGMTQNDIRRILAYSTISQLGYMMLALGIGTTLAYTAGIFHLFTHAFFKSLLFLGAGSVIHAVHTQNIHEMGGLGKKMKITAWTFAIGALALSGIFPFSGFWSKDTILAAAYEQNALLFWVGLITAFFTAFYMSRLFFLEFAGKAKSSSIEAAHESPRVMTYPLIILAVLAIGAGFVFMPGNAWLGTWLSGGETVAEHANWTVMILSNVFGIGGIALGWMIYVRKSVAADVISSRAPWLYQLVHNKYYIDEIYHVAFVRSVRGIGKALNAFDDVVIDGIVRLAAYCMVFIGKVGTRLQNGQLQTYGLIILLGFVVLVLAIAGRRFL